jgi:dissimilatory sulfite reductase (desulfoviridin) alpha/beta subunit
VWLGADLDSGRFGRVAGRVAEDAVASVVDAIVGLWEAVRAPAEPLSATVERVGLEGFAAQLASITDSFEPGEAPVVDSPERSAAMAGLSVTTA